MRFIHQPIPPIPSVKGWEGVPLCGRSEALAAISPTKGKLVARSYYYQAGIPGSLKEVYIRESLLKMLLEASLLLPEGYRFVLWDGYRPLQVQQFLYDTYLKQVREKHPELPPEEWGRLASQFVSKPTMDPNKPYPHVTGGSVDLTIMDGEGLLLDMGTDFDEFSEKAHTRYFEWIEEKRELTPEEKVCQENRRLLYHAMASAGFSNYQHDDGSGFVVHFVPPRGFIADGTKEVRLKLKFRMPQLRSKRQFLVVLTEPVQHVDILFSNQMKGMKVTGVPFFDQNETVSPMPNNIMKVEVNDWVLPKSGIIFAWEENAAS